MCLQTRQECDDVLFWIRHVVNHCYGFLMNCVLAHPPVSWLPINPPLFLNLCFPSIHLHPLLLWEGLLAAFSFFRRKEGMPRKNPGHTCAFRSESYILTMRRMNLGHDRPRRCRSFPGETSQTSSPQPEERKRGQLRGDNENCLGVCVCAWWALFMKPYCTNDPKQPCSSLTTKIHHKLCKVVQPFFFFSCLEQTHSRAVQCKHYGRN